MNEVNNYKIEHPPWADSLSHNYHFTLLFIILKNKVRFFEERTIF